MEEHELAALDAASEAAGTTTASASEDSESPPVSPDTQSAERWGRMPARSTSCSCHHRSRAAGDEQSELVPRRPKSLPTAVLKPLQGSHAIASPRMTPNSDNDDAPGEDDLTRKFSSQQRQNYLLDVCRGFMIYGAPTYRLEEYMHITGNVVGLPLESFYIPGCMIISFKEHAQAAKEVHIVRAEESLNLCKLDDVRKVYKGVIHGTIGVDEGIQGIENINTHENNYPQWVTVLMYGLASAFIGPFSYGARPVDLPIIFLLGSLLGFLQLFLAARSRLYRHVFEISVAILTTFVARALGSIRLSSESTFCFSAISQASLVMILPGFTITNSALELQSKNMVSGAVRMVYGIIFVLFLAFGVMLGATIYGAMDSNATSSTQCSSTWPFWWHITFVPIFTVCYIIINQGRWRQMPSMVILALIGWNVNHFSAERFKGNQQIAQALGALTTGVLANLYSRFTRQHAYSLMYPAIFVQVPGSFAATGSLLSGIAAADNLTRTSSNSDPSQASSGPLLQAGYSMIEIAIAITVGLSVGSLVVYPFRKNSSRTIRSGIFSF